MEKEDKVKAILSLAWILGVVMISIKYIGVGNGVVVLDVLGMLFITVSAWNNGHLSK